MGRGSRVSVCYFRGVWVRVLDFFSYGIGRNRRDLFIGLNIFIEFLLYIGYCGD